MRDHGMGHGQGVIVALPPVVDASAGRASDGLYGAVDSRVPVVIADFTATVHLDAAGVHGLLILRDRAEIRDAGSGW